MHANVLGTCDSAKMCAYAKNNNRKKCMEKTEVSACLYENQATPGKKRERERERERRGGGGGGEEERRERERTGGRGG